LQMKLECMPCFVRQVLMELDGSDITMEGKEKALRASLRRLSEMDMTLPPVGVSLILHRLLREWGVGEDPYRELKMSSTSKALKILPDLERMLDENGDRLKMAAMMAIAGNVIDYGAANLLSLERTLEDAVHGGMAVDDFEDFGRELLKADTLSYHLDNSGEVVLDGLFIREIIRERPDLRIRAFVKNSPLLNDVTLKDAVDGGLGAVDNVELIELPHEGWVSEDDIDSDEAEIIIAKGQGNYESLSESGRKNLFFLLVVKCDVVSRELGADIGEMIFKRS